jgi:hypothetical protein
MPWTLTNTPHPTQRNHSPLLVIMCCVLDSGPRESLSGSAQVARRARTTPRVLAGHPVAAAERRVQRTLRRLRSAAPGRVRRPGLRRGRPGRDRADLAGLPVRVRRVVRLGAGRADRAGRGHRRHGDQHDRAAVEPGDRLMATYTPTSAATAGNRQRRTVRTGPARWPPDPHEVSPALVVGLPR